MRSRSGQALTECVLCLLFILPFVTGAAWIMSGQWHRTACLTRTFREARARLGAEGETLLSTKSENLPADPVFVYARSCAPESMPATTESITFQRLENGD